MAFGYAQNKDNVGLKKVFSSMGAFFARLWQDFCVMSKDLQYAKQQLIKMGTHNAWYTNILYNFGFFLKCMVFFWQLFALTHAIDPLVRGGIIAMSTVCCIAFMVQQTDYFSHNEDHNISFGWLHVLGCVGTIIMAWLLAGFIYGVVIAPYIQLLVQYITHVGLFPLLPDYITFAIHYTFYVLCMVSVCWVELRDYIKNILSLYEPPVCPTSKEKDNYLNLFLQFMYYIAVCLGIVIYGAMEYAEGYIFMPYMASVFFVVLVLHQLLIFQPILMDVKEISFIHAVRQIINVMRAFFASAIFYFVHIQTSTRSWYTITQSLCIACSKYAASDSIINRLRASLGNFSGNDRDVDKYDHDMGSGDPSESQCTDDYVDTSELDDVPVHKK